MSQLKRHIIVTLLLWLVVGFSFAQDKVATKPQKESDTWKSTYGKYCTLTWKSNLFDYP